MICRCIIHPSRMFAIVSCLLFAAAVCEAQVSLSAFAIDAPGRVTARGVGGAVDGLVAETRLAGCEAAGEVQHKELENGGVEFFRELAQSDGDGRCLLTETFTPTGHGLRWMVEVQGTGAPWTTSIETHLALASAEDLVWWTAWGDSRPDAREAATSWNDPLIPARFENATYVYGGRSFRSPQAFSIPLVCILDPAQDRGVTVALSPEDLMLDMALAVTEAGEMTFSRTRHRITADHPVRFALDIVAHEGDWRAGLGWMAERYAGFFDSPNPRAHGMAGCGAYSSHSTNFDPERLRRMAFRINWKASFDFPYMGMFIPPVPDDTTQWVDFKGKTTSIRRMRDDIRALSSQGFHVLNYFNVTEFGARIAYPPPERKAVDDADLWRDPNDFLYHVLGGAILPGRDGKPISSWEGCVAMDPGDPVYRDFLLAQAQRHIEAFPESSGICIDRMDWLQFFNPRFDDGVSWVDGKAARSLVVSWHGIMAKLGPMLHDANKVIFCNPHYRRLDLMRQVDGVYDEFGQMGHSMNLCALLCVRKPVMEWTVPVKELLQTPDAYFQRHLHMGAYLTAPLPGNDHTILPSAGVDQYYFDYGPLLDVMRGKRWVLEPHAVKVEGDAAKANLFEVPGGYVAPVTFGGEAREARVVLRHLKTLPEQKTFRVDVIHPGEEEWTQIDTVDAADELVLAVPLKRGCAMVRLSAST